MSDAKGAFVLLGSLPPAKMLLADKAYDADWFREALAERGIKVSHVSVWNLLKRAEQSHKKRP